MARVDAVDILIIIQLRHETHATVDIQERQSQFLPPDFSWGSSQGGATVTGKHVTCRRPRDDHYCAGSSIKVNISIDLLQQVTICVRVRRAGRGDLPSWGTASSKVATNGQPCFSGLSSAELKNSLTAPYFWVLQNTPL